MKDYDDFLYSRIGGGNGSETTILSSLARLDLDPWHVARQLSAIPKDEATRHLTRLLAGHSIGAALQPSLDLQTSVDRLPARQRMFGRPIVWRKRYLVPVVFFGANMLLFGLLCLSLLVPRPEKDVGSAKHVDPLKIRCVTGIHCR